jgi:hypothetical protein
MKKLALLIFSIGALSLMTWYIIDLQKNKGKSDTELIEFSIKDTVSVNKIIISDPYGRSIELVKQKEQWTDKDGGCVSQQGVWLILEAFQNIEFKGYLPDSSHKQYTKLMSSQHTKVEIFQNGSWTKTWFIGPSSKDHYGQIMLLDSKEYGKSDFPVLMQLKGVNGIIEPRFYADKRKWVCSNIFSIPIHKLSKVDVKFNDEPERSFTVSKTKYDMRVYQQGKLLKNVDTAMVFRYLHNYQKIHFDYPNFVLNEKQIDSLKATIPFSVLTITQTDGKKMKLRCFRIRNKEPNEEGFIEYSDNNRDRFWCELPSGEMVKCQYFVFNPLLLGHIYFPMDISMLKTVDGILEK